MHLTLFSNIELIRREMCVCAFFHGRGQKVEGEDGGETEGGGVSRPQKSTG